jgi:hypothetical protein
MPIRASSPFFVAVQPPGAAVEVTTQSFVCATSGRQPIFWGQTFKKGDVPAGSYVTSDEPTFSAQPISTWSDGSLRFAICAAEPTMTAAAPLVVRLARTNLAPLGAVLTRADLVAASPSVELTLTDVVSASGVSTMADTTLTLASILDSTATHGADPALHRAGLYDEWLGPTMSVFRYRGHFPDRHIRVYWDVYLFASGAMNIETTVEVSTWWNVGGDREATRPGQRDFDVTLAIDGSERFTTVGSRKLKQPHHTRWSRADWLSATQPVVEPRYDVEYLKQTMLVANYEPGTMAETRWDVYAWKTAEESAAPPPLGQGNWPDTMASGGEDSDFIGELLACSAAYLASGDNRGYHSTIAHARTAGRYGYHCRDELTGRVARPIDYPLWVLSTQLHPSYYYGEPGGSSYTPDPTGESLQTVCDYYGWSDYALEYDWLHGPTSGYLAALLTGRLTFVDECQFQYAYAVFASSEGARGRSRIEVGTRGEGRVPGHQLKAVAQAMAVTPDRDTALLASMAATVENSIDTFHGRITEGPFAGNPLGILCYGFHENYGTDYNFISCVHLGYFAWGVIVTEALDLPITATHRARLHEVAAQAIKPCVGRAQAAGEGYNYRRRSAYGDKAGTGATDSSGPTAWYASWGEVYRESRLALTGSAADSLSDEVGEELVGGYSSDEPAGHGSPPHGPMGFCVSRSVQDLPALARAADLGHEGARAAYSVIRGSATFTRLASDFETFSRRFLARPVTADRE